MNFGGIRWLACLGRETSQEPSGHKEIACRMAQTPPGMLIHPIGGKMKIYATLLLVSLIPALLIAQQRPATRPVVHLRRVVDLTHSLNDSTPTYEETKQPPYRVNTVATFDKDHYFAREICLPEHFGTHL